MAGSDADQIGKFAVAGAVPPHRLDVAARGVKYLNLLGVCRICEYARRRDRDAVWPKTGSRVERGRVRARGVEYLDPAVLRVSHEQVRAVVRKTRGRIKFAVAGTVANSADLACKRAVAVKHRDVVVVALGYKQVGGVGCHVLGARELAVAAAAAAELARKLGLAVYGQKVKLGDGKGCFDVGRARVARSAFDMRASHHKCQNDGKGCNCKEPNWHIPIHRVFFPPPSPNAHSGGASDA